MSAMLQIQTLSDGSTPSYSQQVNLSGTDYVLTLNWNTYGQLWTLNLDTSDGVSIVAGRTVVPNLDLLECVPLTSLRPPGPLFVWQAQGEPRRPGLNDLGIGASHGLFYWDPRP